MEKFVHSIVSTSSTISKEEDDLIFALQDEIYHTSEYISRIKKVRFKAIEAQISSEKLYKRLLKFQRLNKDEL